MARARLSVVVVLGAGVAGASDGLAQFEYVEVSGERGILSYAVAEGMGSGAAAADYDDDGDVDIFVPTVEGTPNQLYRNLGNGHFEEIAADVGVASLERARVALWLDYDADHRLDLFVAGDCFLMGGACPDGPPTLALYRQRPDGGFDDVTLDAGFGVDAITTDRQHRGGLCAGDLDGDGYVDLVTGVWKSTARVFLNGRTGWFTEISPDCGIGGVEEGHWQPVMHDFSGDGRLDVFTAIDFRPNRLWVNGGNLTFEDQGLAAGVGIAWNDMGVTIGDYDNDGDIDIYVTEILELGRHTILLRNDSSEDALVFTEVGKPSGVHQTGWGWGTTFLDADRDGRLDIAATNGFFSEPWSTDPSCLFLNQGGDPVTFVDVASEVGFADGFWGSAFLAVDFDRDGDLDVLQTCNNGGPIRLLDNRPSGAAADNGWLLVRPRMDGPNHWAIGAVVRATAGDLEMMRVITAGTSYLGQEPAEAFFGLGTATIVDQVRIEWPDGTCTRRRDIPADQVVTIEPGGCAGADLDGDGSVGFSDIARLLAHWGPCPDSCCAEDLDGDGTTTFGDILVLLAAWGACEG